MAPGLRGLQGPPSRSRSEQNSLDRMPASATAQSWLADTTGDDNWNFDPRLSPDIFSQSCMTPEPHVKDSTSSISEQNQRFITPFLTTHIPEQYGTLGRKHQSQPPEAKSNTKFCYRHRADPKCRRQANEPSMQYLQTELGELPQSDQQGISHAWSLFSAAPPKQRKLILEGILAQCCFPQLSFISACVRDLVKIDFLSALPDEIGLKILCFLDPTSICKAAQVSERWRKLADDDVVWHKMCEQHIDRKCTECGWGLPLLDRKRLRTEKRQIQLRATGQQAPHTESHDVDGSHNARSMSNPSQDRASLQAASLNRINGFGKRPADSDSSDTESDAKRARTASAHDGSQEPAFKPRIQAWKDVYRDRFKIGYNWKHGRCSIKTFKGHTNGVMCLQFDGNLLATGSYDTTIKLWDIDAGTEVCTLTGHALGVRCLQFDDSKLVSGSLDGTIKMWDLKSGRLLRTLTGLKGGVLSLHFDHNFLVCGSVDKTIKVWNFLKGSTFVLRGHLDWINSVKVDSASRTLFSASDDCTVRLWDLDSKTCMKVFKGHTGQVQSVVPLPPEFEYVPLDDTTPPNGANPQTDPSDAGAVAADPSTMSTAGIETLTDYTSVWDPERAPAPRYMLTGGLDNHIRLWDVKKGTCLRIFFGHLEGIWALAADTLRIVSGGNDGMVKIWDPRSGKCEKTFTNHTGPVTCVGLSDRRMCTGSEDHEVRMYNFSVPSSESSN